MTLSCLRRWFSYFLLDADHDASRLAHRKRIGPYLLIFLCLSAGIGAVGYYYFTLQVTAARANAVKDLSAIADLKTRRVAEWRQERLADAQAVTNDPFIGLQVEKFLRDPEHSPLRASLLAWLDLVRRHNQGLRAVLLDRQMIVRLVCPEDQHYFGPIAHTHAREALVANEAVMSDLHRSQFSGKIHLDLAVPIHCRELPEAHLPPVESASQQSAAIIDIEVDPDRFLFPHIQDWPTPSRTAETLLVRREGNEVVFLNELRHKKGTALSLRLPINGDGLAAGQAVHGGSRTVEGIDYRGRQVLAATRSIPGTPWFLVAKVDQVEVYAGLREHALTTGFMVIALVLITAMILGFLARRNNAQLLRNQLALERKHRLILDSANEGILGLDSEGKHVFANLSACRMLGYEPEELIGKSSHAIWHYQKTDDSPYLQEDCPILLAFKEGRTFHSDREVFWRKDGTSLPVEYTSTPSMEDGRPVAVVLTFRDITERRRNEEALQASEARLRAITDSAQDAILMMTPLGAIAYWNPAAESILGYRSDEAIGTNLHNLLVPERYLAAHRAVFPEFVRTGRGNAVGKTIELMVRRKDGQEIAVSLSLSAVSLNGEWHAVGILRDITERKKADDDRALDQQRMESLLTLSRTAEKSIQEITEHAVEESIRLTGSSIGYLALMDDEERILTMHYWSKSAHASCRMIDKPIVYPIEKTGLWGEAVRQRKAIVTNDYAASNPHKRGTPEGHVPVTRHMNIPVFDGSRIVAVAGVGNKPNDYDDRDIRQLQLLMDGWRHIVRRKQAEEELIEARHAAEAATRAKSCFLANMSHEIRTPMTAILGFADILLDDLQEPQAREAAEIVKRNGEHLLTIINDILDISKIEAGKIEMEMLAWSPRQIVAEVVSLLHVRADARGLTLVDEYVGPLPETITIDPTRLRQVLLNVVGNAIKFTQSGSVRIVTRLDNPSSVEPKLRFDVIDTGIGIPADRIENLFEPFTQIEASSSRRFEGTGLGLAISRRLARMLGGDITAQSTLGNGSTFTVTVATGPLDAVRLVEYRAEPSPPEEHRILSSREPQERLRCRVLLADDIPDNQRLISSILREAGAEVIIVQNGQEAMDKAMAVWPGRGRRHSDSTQPFDVVLMDIQMPILDGLQATRRLRKEGYTAPIIALTAHAMRGDREKCLDAGCDDYLTKPIDRKKLIEALQTWMLKRPARVEADVERDTLVQHAENTKQMPAPVVPTSGSHEYPERTMCVGSPRGDKQ
jgi:PAS domain S-box-containing protein